MESWETVIAPTVTMGQCATVENAKPLTLGKGVICWNLQWDILPREMNCFTLLDEGELLSLHWDPLILLQTGPVKMH